jgi:DMSO/TMAO reductase YedYZ heme-binding membrane subunit
MARNTFGSWTGEQTAAVSYQPVPRRGPAAYPPAPRPQHAPGDRRLEEKPPRGSQPQRAAKSRLDEWMEVEFMLPALCTVNSNTFAESVDDTLGTGAEICLFLCLLVTPLVTITGQRWFVPLRRWYGIMMACTALGDAIAASITDNFAGGVFGRLAGHVFELMGFMMVMLVIPLLITGNPRAQRKLGRYWKRLHRITYAIWGLLALHLMLLEGIVLQSGSDGSGFAGDGDPIFHQRFYQYSACSLFLLALRLPPVKRWIAARRQEGRNWLVYLTIGPVFALFLFGFIFIFNEELFKGIDSFTEQPSAE